MWDRTCHNRANSSSVIKYCTAGREKAKEARKKAMADEAANKKAAGRMQKRRRK